MLDYTVYTMHQIDLEAHPEVPPASPPRVEVEELVASELMTSREGEESRVPVATDSAATRGRLLSEVHNTHTPTPTAHSVHEPATHTLTHLQHTQELAGVIHLTAVPDLHQQSHGWCTGVHASPSTPEATPVVPGGASPRHLHRYTTHPCLRKRSMQANTTASPQPSTSIAEGSDPVLIRCVQDTLMDALPTLTHTGAKTSVAPKHSYNLRKSVRHIKSHSGTPAVHVTHPTAHRLVRTIFVPLGRNGVHTA